MASVTLKLNPRNVRADGSRTILIEVLYKRKRKVVNTGATALPGQWHNGNIVPAKHPGGKRYQIELAQMVVQINRQMLLAELANETAATAFARISTNTATATMLFDFVATVANNWQRSGHVGNARVYWLTLAELQKTMPNVALAQLDYAYLHTFKLKKTIAGCSNNTLHFYFKTLRAVYNEAAKRGLVLGVDPFKRGLMPRTEATAKRWVPWHVVLTLECCQLSPQLDLARNMWLLGLYLRGCDFIDLAHLTPANIVGGRIEYKRQKTGKPLSVAIHPKAAAILEKYNTGTGYLLPLITQPMQTDAAGYYYIRQRVNLWLRQIAAQLGIAHSISTKTNRHTWATRAQQLGVPRDVIAEALAHTIKGVTAIYLGGYDAATLDAANNRVVGAPLCHAR